MFGDDRQRVQPRVGEAGDLAEQDLGLGFADLGDALGFALAGEDALLALGLGGDDRLLGVLAGTFEVGIRLVAGDFDLHLRAGQLRLTGGGGLGFVELFLLLGRGALALIRLDLLER